MLSWASMLDTGLDGGVLYAATVTTIALAAVFARQPAADVLLGKC